ncbi:MAG: class I SAM-dependent methyltransferase [Deltaproteobacteria bacterium]|nr:class I SAM-dependent methyltransferase [Deltaproteobacteria bacterium]MBW2421753.1 class I SAM-dependent methyltransferase [Deltaproteobacteria bacterium]
MFVKSFSLKSFVKEMLVNLTEIAGYGSTHPWRGMERLAFEQTVAFINEHCPRAIGVASQRKLFKLALPQVGDGDLYLEFGVYTGGSINYLARKLPGRAIHGFDSFQGLPEDWLTFRADYFSLGGRPPKVRDNVILHQGWFDETLPQFVDIHPGKVAFLHIDCDTYGSTKTLFDHLGPRLVPGSVIVFDDYFNQPGWQEDGHKAFGEFLATSDLEPEYIGYAYKELAVRLK